MKMGVIQGHLYFVHHSIWSFLPWKYLVTTWDQTLNPCPLQSWLILLQLF